MKKLILMSGVPGSGKSTWANKYKIDHKNENVFIVASDEIRKELGGRYQYFDEENKVWSLFLSRTNDYAKLYNDVTVIMDATNLTNHYRLMYLNSTPCFDFHTLINFNLPLERVLKQNKMREDRRVVNEDAMKMLINEYEDVSSEVMDSFDEYIEIK